MNDTIEASAHDWHKERGRFSASDATWRNVEIEVLSGEGGPHFGPYGQIRFTDDDGRLLVITLSPADFERLGDEIRVHGEALAVWQQYGE